MTEQELLSELESICEYNDWGLSTDYSGRGMYGKTCVAIVTDESPWDLARELVEELEEKAEQAFTMLGHLCSDSMGLNKVHYFPTFQLTKQ